MDLVTLHLCFGDHVESVSLRVPDGFGKVVSGAFDDLMHDLEPETERFFYRMNDGSLETVFACSEVQKGSSVKVKPRFRAIQYEDWKLRCEEQYKNNEELF